MQGYPNCDAEVAEIGREVWGDCDGQTIKERKYGKGLVIWGMSMQEVTARIALQPDFEFRSTGGSGRLVYIHRKIGGAEVYFVSNQEYRTIAADCRFRVAGKLPELWHADTGAMEPAPFWRQEKGRTVVSLRLDPAQSVFVVFRKPAPSGHLVSGFRQGPEAPKDAVERIEIKSARYEAIDGSRGADVTARVAQMVAEGYLEVSATNDVFGDPVPDVVKQLRMEWTVDGKLRQATEREGSSIALSSRAQSAVPSGWDVRITPKGTALLTAWRAGVYEFRTSAGKVSRVRARADAAKLTAEGPWTVRFQPGWGAPERTTFPRLVSWTDHSDEGIRYFSGWAVYSRTLDVPAGMAAKSRHIELDLGTVKHFAEVTLNGKRLGTLWKAPFRLDVTGVLKAGRNTLEIKVTNLWPNRLIGDEQLPPEVEWNGNAIKAWPDWVWSGAERPRGGRRTFTTWRFWHKDSALIESGLLGPVTVRSAAVIAIPTAR